MKITNAWIKTQNTEEKSLINCDFVEMQNNHLLFYLNKKLVFKVWLKKEYKTLEDAVQNVRIKITQVNVVSGVMEENKIYSKEALESLDTSELLSEIEESCEECEGR